MKGALQMAETAGSEIDKPSPLPPAEAGKSSSKKLIAVEAHSFSGPIPPPEILAQYGQIIPDGADRILKLAEKQAEHRMYLEKTVIESDVRRSDRGLILGFFIVLALGVGGLILVGIGRSAEGLAAMLVPLAGLGALFVHVQNTRRQERLERSKNPSEPATERGANK
ncbi:MAG: DUF2335 domain-containing protein [Anaerolineae bacterium]|nr:DUF2335 domain-containing protein [Anaerolineae bacterium]